MRNRKFLLLAAVALIVLLSVVGIFYRNLSAGYEAESMVSDPGELAPDFSMLDENGDTVRLSDFSDVPVVLNFWATWCPPCRGELPYFNDAYADYGDRVAFVMTDLTDGQEETIEVVQDFLAEQGYTFPVYYDTNAEGAYAYEVNAIPSTYFINADGTLYSYQIGALSREALYDQLEKIVE